MLWAQEIFMNDTKMQSWKAVIDEFGPAVVTSLRTYAAVLKKEVKATDLKKKNARPQAYITWIKKLTSKV